MTSGEFDDGDSCSALHSFSETKLFDPLMVK